jgi:plasmid stabilization system protein ParE
VSFRLRVSRRAARQVRAASTWWLENRDKAPLAFSDDLDDAFELIVDNPKLGEPIHHTTILSARRLLMRRTQFYLYYSIDEQSKSVEVLALWHTSRGTPPTL